MSISNEISRIRSAKQNIKSSIERRGVPVGEEDTLGVYAEKISSAPFAVRGTFTPEEDATEFILSGLDFSPKIVYCSCLEFEENTIANSIEFFALCKQGYGVVRYRNSELERLLSNIGINSSVVQWYEDGVKFTVVQGSIPKFFKAGYTYEYFVMGGFEL